MVGASFFQDQNMVVCAIFLGYSVSRRLGRVNFGDEIGAAGHLFSEIGLGH